MVRERNERALVVKSLRDGAPDGSGGTSDQTYFVREFHVRDWEDSSLRRIKVA
jgi:hypothetical protein